MKRALTVLALAGGVALMPTAAFATTGDVTAGTVTVTPIFLVGSPAGGGAGLDVAGPPMPMGPYVEDAKHAAEDAKHAAEEARHAVEEAKHAAEHAAEEAKHAAEHAAEEAKHAAEHAADGKLGKPTLNGLASVTSYSPWNNAALVSGGGRTFG